MKHVVKKVAMTAVATAALIAASNSHAVSWLMLQGTEPSSAAGRAKVWGFVQTQYQKDFSSDAANGNYIPPKLIGPNLTSQEQFNVNRARIGVRGTGMPIDPKVNYFVLTELGNNAITAANEGSTFITDASVTLNHIPGARVRMGLFKTPGFEEGLQAIHVFDYINFTTVGNQLMLERFPNQRDGVNAPGNAGVPPQDGGLNTFDRPVGAFRDVGIQVFDTFKVGTWELSYAAMVGNGNGLNFGDNDANKDFYGYFSAEWVLGDKGGPRRPGLKMFTWSQTGKRQLDNTNDGTYNPQSYDRTRTGLGVKYLQMPFRATVEYLEGDGMIFVGPDKASFDINGPGPNGNGAEGEASGYYLDFGFYLPNTAWQFDLRYDVYDRLEGDQFEFHFETWTAGVNYNLNKKSRITTTWSNTGAEAVNFGDTAGPNAQLRGLGERFAIQLTHIF